jgi:AcrR family transcriptional regulator
MKYSKEHKQETRQRIIKNAGPRFKNDGIDGSGVATLMKDAGLTNGAFYAHFASKDSLIAITIADQLQTLHENIPLRPNELMN